MFSSRVRAKILALFFLSPGQTHFALDIAKTTQENYSAVWKELVKLENLGILASQARGRVKEYKTNPACPIISELRSMILKTEGLGEAIRQRLAVLPGLKAVFIFGSYASGEADERSDLDLMLIGTIDLEILSPVIASLEKQLTRPINYLIYPAEDWEKRAADRDPFVENVISAPKIFLIGDENAL